MRLECELSKEKKIGENSDGVLTGLIKHPITKLGMVMLPLIFAGCVAKTNPVTSKSNNQELFNPQSMNLFRTIPAENKSYIVETKPIPAKTNNYTFKLGHVDLSRPETAFVNPVLKDESPGFYESVKAFCNKSGYHKAGCIGGGIVAGLLGINELAKGGGGSSGGNNQSTAITASEDEPQTGDTQTPQY